MWKMNYRLIQCERCRSQAADIEISIRVRNFVIIVFNK